MIISYLFILTHFVAYFLAFLSRRFLGSHCNWAWKVTYCTQSSFFLASSHHGPQACKQAGHVCTKTGADLFCLTGRWRLKCCSWPRCTRPLPGVSASSWGSKAPRTPNLTRGAWSWQGTSSTRRSSTAFWMCWCVWHSPRANCIASLITPHPHCPIITKSSRILLFKNAYWKFWFYCKKGHLTTTTSISFPSTPPAPRQWTFKRKILLVFFARRQTKILIQSFFCICGVSVVFFNQQFEQSE